MINPRCQRLSANDGFGALPKSKKLIRTVICLIAVFSLAESRSESVLSKPVAVIVNSSNAIGEMSMSELSRIYRGIENRWHDGQNIVAVNRPAGSAIRKTFYKVVLDEGPTKKFFKPGSPIPFKTMNLRSDLAVIRFVSRVKGAIAYVMAEQLPASVQAIKIDGKSYQEKDYRLRTSAHED